MKTTFNDYKNLILEQKLLENSSFSATKDWFINIIDNIKGFVRSNTTKIKYKDYLNAIENFSEENQTISKKELTKIKNDLGSLCATYYHSVLSKEVMVQNDRGSDRMEKSTESKEDLAKLLKKRGYDNIYFAKNDGKTDLVDIYNSLSYLHIYSIIDPKRNLEKIEKSKSLMNTDELNWINKYYANLDKWVELSEKIIEIELVLNPTKEQKQRNELKKITVKGVINPKLKDAVDKIAEDFRIVIEQNEYNYYKETIDELNTKYPESMESGVFWKEYKTKDFISLVYTEGKKTNTTYGTPFHLIPNYDEKLKKRALDVSHNFILPFQIKMYDKLSGFMKELDKKFDVSVYGRTKNSNNIHFTFEDSSKFSIQNSIVSKFSHLGTFFYTYPTTFHDAYLPNGEKISNPNEYTVKTAFNKYSNEAH